MRLKNLLCLMIDDRVQYSHLKKIKSWLEEWRVGGLTRWVEEAVGL